MKILIVEDEQRLANSLKTMLESKGFTVQVAYDGESGADRIRMEVYDLLILDVMMPKLNGYELAKHLRDQNCTMPILMLTAKSDVEDRIRGLNSGADYYLTKPFDTRELLACINALLRRRGRQVDALTFGDISLDMETCVLFCGDRSVRLTSKEFHIMRIFLQNQTRIVSKETLLARVWGFDSNAVENHVEVYIAFLRRKLEKLGAKTSINTARRLGYFLWTPEEC